jgi:hypothetical protein
MLTIFDSFLDESLRDLKAAKLLTKKRLYSPALYHLEQCLEKGSKSLYCYYEIIRMNASENETYSKLKNFGHDNTKTIPEIYCKICDLEEQEIDKLPTTNSDVARVQLHLKEAVEGFRSSIKQLKDKIKNRTLIDEKKLVENYAAEVDRAYQNYKKLPSIVQTRAPKILKQKNLTGTENATKPDPFLSFITLSRNLISCILIKNDLYRYPSMEFKNKNLEILNKPEMAKACNHIIEMMDDFIDTIPKIMKKGLIAKW